MSEFRFFAFVATPCLFICLLGGGSTCAQNVKLTGVVMEQNTSVAIPFASLYFTGSGKGGVCDENGKFSVPGPQQQDTLRISALGFKTQNVLVKSTTKSLGINLESSAGQLNEVRVMGYKDPGKMLIKKVIAHKNFNDPRRFQRYSRKEYLKTEIDLFNLKSSQNKALIQQASKAYMKLAADTSALLTLPVYFCEQYFSTYHTGAGDTDLKTLISKKTMSLSTDQLAPKFEKFNIVPNIYDGIIPILKTTFTGPVSDIGLAFYHFEIEDTLKGEPFDTFRVSFMPKSSSENTFSGSLWVEDETFAIKKVQMQSSPGANLNFIRSLKVAQQFQSYVNKDRLNLKNERKKNPFVSDSVWLLAANTTSITFRNGLQLLGLPVKEDTAGKQVSLTNKTVFSTYKLNAQREFYQVAETALTDEQRPEPLSQKEKAIYASLDSLRSSPSFNRGIKLTTLMATGYWDFGDKVRVGPLSSLVSGNYVEGIRMRSGFWTREGFNKIWNFNGYLAYGLKDQRLKTGLGVKYVPSRAPYRKTELFLRQDYDMITENDDELDNDNVFTLGLRKNIPAYQVFIRQMKLLQEYDLNHNWSAKFLMSYKDMDPTFKLNYVPPEDSNQSGSMLHKISTAEVGFNLRYAHNERTSIFNYDKIRIYTRYPVLNLSYVHGFEMLRQNYFDYDKINLGVMQEFNMPVKGTFYYNLNFGKVFGMLPYLLLNIPRGNPSYVSSKYAFNNMRPFEFAADRYTSLMLRYSLGGLLLDHVPLLQKLNIRERLIANFYQGSLSQANKTYNSINPVNATGKTPYAEGGFGFENIFNVLTIDAVWRLNHNGFNTASRFGIFTGIKIAF